MRRARALARTMLLSLAFGLFATLLGAWPLPMTLLGTGLIAHTNWSADTFWASDTHGGHYTVSHLALSDWVIFKRIIFVGAPSTQPYYRRNPPPDWAALLTLNDEFQEVHTAATGWPWRAFASESWQRWTPGPGEASEELRHNILLRRVAGGRLILPLRPIWPGLLADVGVYGAGALAIGLIVGAWRRARRRRGGLCPACAYDLRATPAGSPCPECGTPTEARTSAGGPARPADKLRA